MLSLLSSIWQGIRDDPLILSVALYCFGMQAFLTVAFNTRLVPFDGPWKTTSLFSAKQFLTTLLMVYQTYYGFAVWFGDKDYDATTHPPSPNVLEEASRYRGGLVISRIILGTLISDIPIGFLSGSVDTMMHVHHLGMFLVATIALGFWSSPIKVPLLARYAPFFFGVIELSSIPLAIVDVFHPHKQPAWHRYASAHPWLQLVNEISRYSFALLYILIRMIYFPLVIFRQVVPDCWSKLHYQYQSDDDIIINSNNDPYKGPIWTIMLCSLAFTGLQLYWGILVLKQVAKALGIGGSGAGDNSDDDKEGKKIKAKIKSV